MIRVAKLTDPEAVRTVLSEIWQHIRDDYIPEECQSVVIGPTDVYVGIWDDDLVAAYYFRPITSTLWEGHINVRPSAWGGCDRYTHAAIDWMRESTPCQKVIGFIPVDCEAVLRHVARCGFKAHTVLSGAVQKGGAAVDMVMVEY